MRDGDARPAGPVGGAVATLQTHLANGSLLSVWRATTAPPPPAGGAGSPTPRGTEVGWELKDCRGGLFQDDFGSGRFGPADLGWVWRLPGCQAVMSGNNEVVIAFGEESEVLATGGGCLEAAVGLP